MEEEKIPPTKSGPNFSRMLMIVFLVILSAAFLIGLYFLVVFKKSDIEVRGGDSVITQLRSLNRYESSEYTVEKIIEAGSGSDNAFKNILFGDKILLIANGQVTAGFDLAKLKDNDVTFEGGALRVNLPAPEILVSRLDNEKTRVYDRSKGLLTQGNKDLESIARLSAENSIKKAACEGGILRSATDNARTQLTALLKVLGYNTVVITIPEGSC